MNSFGFAERLEYSRSHVDEDLRRILVNRLPGVSDIQIAETSDDRQGTDYWALRGLSLPDLSVDVKIRSKDFSAHPEPRWRADDLALETWSVCETKVGWTRDPAKRTDLVMWFWTDTRRFFLMPFPPLCCVFARYWEQWRDAYRTERQKTRQGRLEWESECTFVPRAVLIEKVDSWASGHIPAPPPF